MSQGQLGAIQAAHLLQHPRGLVGGVAKTGRRQALPGLGEQFTQRRRVALRTFDTHHLRGRCSGRSLDLGLGHVASVSNRARSSDNNSSDTTSSSPASTLSSEYKVRPMRWSVTRPCGKL